MKKYLEKFKAPGFAMAILNVTSEGSASDAHG